MKKQSAGDVVKRFFPDADDEMVDYALWNRTGFPAFLDYGHVSLIRQVKRFKLLTTWKTNQCDFCGNATKTSMCCFCEGVLDAAKIGGESGV